MMKYDVTVDKLVLLLYYIFANASNEIASSTSDRRTKSSLAKLPYITTSIPYDQVCEEAFAQKQCDNNQQTNEQLSDPPSNSEPFHDLQTLQNTQYLAITVIEDCIVTIIEKANKSSNIQLMSADYVMSTKNIVDTASRIPLHKKVLRLIHTNNFTHWVLGLIDISTQTIYILDSMRNVPPSSQRQRDFLLLDKYATAYIYMCSSQETPIFEWKYIYVLNCPQQTNGYDCGLYCVYYAYCIIKDISLLPYLPTHISRTWMHETLTQITNRPLEQNTIDGDFVYVDVITNLLETDKRLLALEAQPNLINIVTKPLYLPL
jgi:hypothetical protein